MKLEIELIPSTSWFRNLRSILTTKEWNTIRTGCYQKANYRCEICGGVGKKHPVECHEVWNYDDKSGLQTLKSLIALCPDCHEVKHIGFAELKGRRKEAVNHFCKVNECSSNEAEIKIAKAFDIWAKRNKVKWTLDISLLEQLKSK